MDDAYSQQFTFQRLHDHSCRDCDIVLRPLPTAVFGSYCIQLMEVSSQPVPIDLHFFWC